MKPFFAPRLREVRVRKTPNIVMFLVSCYYLRDAWGFVLFIYLR